jgi:aspartyl/asparaginyl beta-hydroxylase (cupin superfamily)/Tfp pilus assembly protein PilF
MAAATVRQHLAEAERAIRAGLRDEARGHFEAAIAIDSDEPTAHNWLGADALARADTSAAVEHFAIACRSEPRERSHWINLATAYRALGDSQQERASLEQALAIDQTDLLALVRIAELHERLNEAVHAAERWSAVLSLARGITHPSPEFAAILAHAKQYVAAQQDKRIDAVDQALAGELAEASPRDARRMRVAADAWLGKRPIYANQCEGLHYPFLPADEFFDRELFPWLAELEAAAGPITAELEAILAEPDPGLTPYISLPPGVPANKWSGLDRSLNWGAFHLWKEGERFDEACARAPRTAALVESLPICRIEGRAPNLFFSILKAGSHIPPHTGVTNVRSVVHLPLIVPEGCEFRVGGERRAWVYGEAFAFDDTIEHEAWNRSDRDRAVLIIDAWNPYLSDHERAMICRLYAAADIPAGQTD